MQVSPLAGKPAPEDILVNVDRLLAAYYDVHPNVEDPAQRVVFGTSGHRGSALDGTFNEAHILAITQAIVEYRMAAGITGPLFLGRDTHALSAPAQTTALEVLAAHGVEVRVAAAEGTAQYTPTPSVSHAILTFNAKRAGAPADGIVITPSHNPPQDGGFKYNPPNGGPADTEITDQVQDRANALLADGNRSVKRIDTAAALRAATTQPYDFVTPYVEDLGSIIDMEAIRRSGVTIGADPLGGASIGYWAPIAQRYGMKLSLADDRVDPTFAFMPVDHDGKIRMDCSSPYAMAGLIAMKDRYRIAFGNDTDADRHGIVTSAGLMNPNAYLAVAIEYLFTRRLNWTRRQRVGKTVVSSSIIDRIATDIGRPLYEVPVGFKWFVDGLFDGSLGFGGEESAGASFLRRDGAVWTTDKDGLIMGLLAAEITAVTGSDPADHYARITRRLGDPCYQRIDAAATPQEKERLKRLTPDAVRADTLAGDRITARLTAAPGNGAPIGGLKVATAEGWFAARPSGTEDIYKIYAESFRGPAHLDQIIAEAQQIVADALRGP